MPDLADVQAPFRRSDGLIEVSLAQIEMADCQIRPTQAERVIMASARWTDYFSRSLPLTDAPCSARIVTNHSRASTAGKPDMPKRSRLRSPSEAPHVPLEAGNGPTIISQGPTRPVPGGNSPRRGGGGSDRPRQRRAPVGRMR